MDWTYIKIDTRPQKGWRAPGGYLCKCTKCGKTFQGDKRAGHCADCEYAESKPLNEELEECLKRMGLQHSGRVADENLRPTRDVLITRRPEKSKPFGPHENVLTDEQLQLMLDTALF